MCFTARRGAFFFIKKNQKIFKHALRAEFSTVSGERSEPLIKVFRFPFLKGNKKLFQSHRYRVLMCEKVFGGCHCFNRFADIFYTFFVDGLKRDFLCERIHVQA